MNMKEVRELSRELFHHDEETFSVVTFVGEEGFTVRVLRPDGEPATPRSYSVTFETSADFTGIQGEPPLEDLRQMAKADLSEGRWEKVKSRLK